MPLSLMGLADWLPFASSHCKCCGINDSVVTLTGEQLNWLLDGYGVWRMKPHEVLHFSVFS